MTFILYVNVFRYKGLVNYQDFVSNDFILQLESK